MLSQEQNDLITRVGPGTAAGTLMRRYWQPAALVDELAGNRPIKPIKLFGEACAIMTTSVPSSTAAEQASPISPLRRSSAGWTMSDIAFDAR